MLTRRIAILSAASTLCGAGPAEPLAAMPIGRADLPWWRARHEAALARNKAGPVDLVWLGDSITQNWEKPDYKPVWDRFYGDRNAVNLGFSGDTTASVLWRLDHGEADGIAPKAVVLLIGANNLGRVHWGAEDTLAGIAAVIGRLRRKLPGAKIALLSVLPRAGDAWVRDTQAQIDAGLAERYARASGIAYVDVAREFVRDGRIDDALYSDPQESPPRPALHPNPAGMTRIATAIEGTLSAFMGDRNKLAG